MKQKLIKFTSVLIALTALADTQFEILLQIGLDTATIGWIRLSGIILALLLPSVNETFKREVDLRDGTFDNSDPQLPTKPKTIR